MPAPGKAELLANSHAAAVTTSPGSARHFAATPWVCHPVGLPPHGSRCRINPYLDQDGALRTPGHFRKSPLINQAQPPRTRVRRCRVPRARLSSSGAAGRADPAALQARTAQTARRHPQFAASFQAIARRRVRKIATTAAHPAGISLPPIVGRHHSPPKPGTCQRRPRHRRIRRSPCSRWPGWPRCRRTSGAGPGMFSRSCAAQHHSPLLWC